MHYLHSSQSFGIAKHSLELKLINFAIFVGIMLFQDDIDLFVGNILTELGEHLDQLRLVDVAIVVEIELVEETLDGLGL